MTSSMLLEKRKGPLGRSVYSLAAATPEEVAEAVHVRKGCHFVLFLAWDARDVTDEAVLNLARALVHKGLAYVVAWGPDCERVHDLFDDVDIELNLEWSTGSETVIMSTWHDTDSLAEALWFSLNTAYPAPHYEATTVSTFAVAIGNAEWAAEIHDFLVDLDSLNRAAGV